MHFLHPHTFIRQQLTTHKVHIITFWFSFSSYLCIKFSPIFFFLLKVSCCFISPVGLVHDKGRATGKLWPGGGWRMIIFFLRRQIGMLPHYYCKIDLKLIINSVEYPQFDIFRKWHSVDKKNPPCWSSIVIIAHWCGRSIWFIRFPSLWHRLVGAQQGTITHSCGRLSLRTTWKAPQSTEQWSFRVRSYHHFL